MVSLSRSACPRTLTTTSQTVTGTITFEGFGATIATTGSSTNPYKFAATSGYRDDGDAGLMHVGARYYDAQVGRFITWDTELGQKPYLYCIHDPANHTDPTGHDSILYAGGSGGMPWDPPGFGPFPPPPDPRDPSNWPILWFLPLIIETGPIGHPPKPIPFPGWDPLPEIIRIELKAQVLDWGIKQH